MSSYPPQKIATASLTVGLLSLATFSLFVIGALAGVLLGVTALAQTKAGLRGSGSRVLPWPGF